MWPLLLSLSALAAPPRHALIIGANNGPRALVPLRYAEDDARRMAEVLTELGGFPAEQVTVLYGPDVAEVQSALERHAALSRSSDDDLFFFYYSGHADNSGLRMGEETLGYAQLRRAVRDMPADVRVGVLDACRSGEITRIKGLEVSTPFAVDHGTASEGEAWLTATTAEESAQESDVLRGSFFTHALITGLRGAADKDDGLVSLAEAYSYAYDNTVSRTGSSVNGIQHPAYDYRLQGRGDLPLTEVRRAEALLVLPEDMEGQITVLSAPENALVAEIAKVRGLSLTLGLPAGRYTLRLRDGDRVQEARVGLSAGSTLSVRGMQPSSLVAASAKGEGGREVSPGRSAETAEDTPLALPVTLSTREDYPQSGPPPVSDAPTDASADASSPAPPEQPLDAEPGGSRVFAGLDQKASRLLQRTTARIDGRLDALLDPVGGGRAERNLRLDLLEPNELSLPVQPCPGPDCLPPQPAEAGMPDGPVLLRGPDGARLAEGELTGGHRSGRWTFWSASGARLAEGAYREGQRSGTWTWWTEGGARAKRGTYDDGQPDGLWTLWYETGDRREQTGYDHGVPHGRYISWYENGIHQREGTLRHGQPEGRWSTWHDNGQRSSRGKFHQGLMTGPWETWHANGQLQSEGEYVAGAREGRWRTWHENGRLESRGRYHQGQLDGRWHSWTASGETASKGWYRDGQPRRGGSAP